MNMGKAILRGMVEGVAGGRHRVRTGREEIWRQINEGSLFIGVYLSRILNMEWRKVRPRGQRGGQGTPKKDLKCNDRLKE